MPRLAPSLFWRARKDISPLAVQLLPACRDLESAENELRWIREHVHATPSPVPAALRVWKLVEKRGRGIPLQYVLGTQPFGELEIQCRQGVLIPRPETEAYTFYLASLLSREKSAASFSILDLCTGTGCIPLLLLHTLLNEPTKSPGRNATINIHGVDISPRAINLARTNLAHNFPQSARQRQQQPSSPPSYTATFTQHDIFSPSLLSHLSHLSHPLSPATQTQPQPQTWDVLTSNPPYISTSGFARSTARSVRNHEPRLALVPDPDLSAGRFNNTHQALPEDVFYARLLEIASVLRPRRVVLEVGSLAQAVRAVRMLFDAEDRDKDRAERGDGGGGGGGGGGGSGYYQTVEIWRDEPAARTERMETVEVEGREVRVRGEGQGRAVYLCRGKDQTRNDDRK